MIQKTKLNFLKSIYKISKMNNSKLNKSNENIIIKINLLHWFKHRYLTEKNVSLLNKQMTE